jgi:catechol 2,3-dioxygenase-like lactoylglutathione lyase family enzyme
MAISGVRFGHVAFRVADVERSVKWYADAFGARKVFHGEPQAGRQELTFLEIAPGQHIEIFTNGKEKSQTPADAIGYQHYCLVVDDIDATIRHLATMNVHPERPVREGRSHYRIAFVADPDGNVIELMEIRPESAIYSDRP